MWGAYAFELYPFSLLWLHSGPLFLPVPKQASTWLCGVPQATATKSRDAMLVFARDARYETSETEEDRPGVGDVFARG